MTWHKSSYSNDTGGECVECAVYSDGIAVRDTQHRELGRLAFAGAEWPAFLAEVKAGRL